MNSGITPCLLSTSGFSLSLPHSSPPQLDSSPVRCGFANRRSQSTKYHPGWTTYAACCSFPTNKTSRTNASRCSSGQSSVAVAGANAASVAGSPVLSITPSSSSPVGFPPLHPPPQSPRIAHLQERPSTPPPCAILPLLDFHQDGVIHERYYPREPLSPPPCTLGTGHLEGNGSTAFPMDSATPI